MTDFDERDLLGFAERVGFDEIHLELEAEIVPKKREPWTLFARTPENPLVPSLDEALSEARTADEAQQLTAHLQPLVETGAGVWRMAHAHLWAAKR